MTKQDFKERRKWIRAKRVLSIQYKLDKSPKKNIDNSWHLSTTQDMSLGGLAFYTEQEFKANDELEIKIVMSGLLEIFSGFVKVVRTEKKKSGAFFLTAVKVIDKKRRRSAKKYK